MSDEPSPSLSPPSVSDLHDMIAKTRGSYFGTEVIKRILTGTFVLSKDSFHDYYGKASIIRHLIRLEIELNLNDSQSVRSNIHEHSTGYSARQNVSMEALGNEQGIHLNSASSGSKCDFIIGITTPTLPFPLTNPPDSLNMMLNDFFTVPANLCGLPAISIPVGVTKRIVQRLRSPPEEIEEVLPIGLQLLGARFSEDVLLRTSLAIEQRVKFSTLIPPCVTSYVDKYRVE